MACLFGHKWNGCKCTKCGKTRDEGHDIHFCTCRICGAKRSENHDWQNGYCAVCGEKQSDPKAVLVGILKSDPIWEKRRDAATALVSHPCDDSLDALIQTMKKDDSWVVRFTCAEALGDIGDKRAISPLIGALSDKENTVIKYAAKALGKLGDERGIEPMLDVMRGFRGGDFTGVSGVIEGLGMMGDAAVPRLLELADSDIGEYVKRALAETGSPKAMEKLGVSKDQLGDASKEAEIAAATRLLEGLRSLKKGMTEREADDLVGGANFGMGANQVHDTSFGSFQLLVANGVVYDMLYVSGVIEKIENYLRDNKS